MSICSRLPGFTGPSPSTSLDKVIQLLAAIVGGERWDVKAGKIDTGKFRQWRCLMNARETRDRLNEAFEAGITATDTMVSWSVRLQSGDTLNHNADIPVEAGSTFKVILLAHVCSLLDRGELGLTQVIVLEGAHRVAASEDFEMLPDGTELTLDRILRAMIGASDNTATQIVQQIIGRDAVEALMSAFGMSATHVPDNLRSVYSQTDSTKAFPAFQTTMCDMRLFYERMQENSLQLSRESEAFFWDVLLEEDRRQGTDWPSGVACYRKSGSVIWDSVNAQAVCGALRKGNTEIPFAFALNRRPGGDASAEETFVSFAPQFGSALRTLLEA